MTADELKQRLNAISSEIGKLLAEVEEDPSEDMDETVVEELNNADTAIDNAIAAL